MRRRRFIELLGMAAASGSVAAGATNSTGDDRTVERLAFPSTGSFHAPGWDPLTDEALVPVWAEESATNDDADYGDDAFEYWDSRRIPMVAVDGNVVGIGSTLVHDSAPDGYDNERFLLNVWDEKLDGSGTVLWDHSHDQYWTLDRFSDFERSAQQAGYDVRPTWDLTDDLPGADAVVIVSPRYDFWNVDLDALAEFVADGGVVFLHGQSDYQNYDETDNLNDITDRLDCAFRFNDDQVYDRHHNDGPSYQPTTTNFNPDFPFFDGSDGGDGGEGGDGGDDDDGDDGGDDGDGGNDDPTTYTAEVTSVADGDTVTVRFNGSEKEIRVLGLDTPEKRRAQDAERTQEWEGIESLDHLGTWGTKASEFASQALSGETVEVFYDENSDKTDPFDRHLMYIRYDADGDGTTDTLYNQELIEKGYARCYDASNAKHDAFQAADEAARNAGRGLWAKSDPSGTPEIRDQSVSSLFVPKPTAVTSSNGSLSDSRVPVRAESTANRSNAPLVGVDSENRLAMVGGLMIDETYEQAEGFGTDTAEYGNFPFLTNLLNSLSATDGDVVLEGGHRQFNDDAALSAEDAAYYMRYLEGQGIGMVGLNDLPNAELSDYQAIIVTTPMTAFSSAEREALASFRDAGGAVVLMGSASADASAVSNLNDLASALGSDLRLDGTTVTDRQNNLDNNGELPITGQFETGFDLFGPYT